MGNAPSYINENFDLDTPTSPSGEAFDGSIYLSLRGLKCLAMDQQEFLVRQYQQTMIANAIIRIATALGQAQYSKDSVDWVKVHQESMTFTDANGNPVAGLDWSVLAADKKTFIPQNVFLDYLNDQAFTANSVSTSDKKIEVLQQYLLQFKRWQDTLIMRRKAACSVKM